VAYSHVYDTLKYHKAVKLITLEQIRAAKQLIRVTADDLASKSGVGVTTIRRFELMAGVPYGNTRSVEEIQAALEEMGWLNLLALPETDTVFV
jgi:transcriptional regulator with XRE-family HTH domain